MRTVPKRVGEKISFFQNHLDQWSSHAAELGISDEDAAEMIARTDAAREAHSNQGIAQAQAMAATETLRQALSAMDQKGAEIILKIRARARAQGKETYAVAQIASPAAPSPIAEPGKPTQLTWELQAPGWLKLKWKCQNPRGSEGTMYQIYRRVADAQGDDQFVYLGNVGKKEFVDDTFPTGGGPLGSVLYKIIAIRSTAVGPAALFPIKVGNKPSSEGAFRVPGRRAA